MFSFFKTKATATEVGIGMLLLTTDLKETERQFGKYFVRAEVNREIMRNEILYLQAFAVDFATAKTLGNFTPKTNAVLDAYFKYWKEMAIKGELGSATYENLESRLLVYMKAINTPYRKTPYQNPIQMVGNAFSKFCDREDMSLVLVGADIFGITAKVVIESIKSFRIKI